jgi:hypothetical protein
MKIIQLVTAVNGEYPGSFESQLLGLGDDGNLYHLIEAYPPKVLVNGRYTDGTMVQQHLDEGKSVTFRDGTTQGWQMICMSIDRPKALPHPLDPTRAERP